MTTPEPATIYGASKLVGDLGARTSIGQLIAVTGRQRVEVMGQDGARSMRVCEFAASQGYDVANVSGGTIAWILSGREMITGETPT